VPFGRLVEQVMTAEPYVRARRVFWIVDNGSSHRGRVSAERLQAQWPNLVLVHLPFYALTGVRHCLLMSAWGLGARGAGLVRSGPVVCRDGGRRARA